MTLAEFILLELCDFPGKRMFFEDLRARAARIPAFAALPQEEWNQTLEDLAK
jgi:hypothetical protein